ncbi:uncharacterized protein TNCV_4658691 [Trichonephila clavipes]|nr:uncharacterized protein TNCV_4658691 [Trichonephila clavipes]
MKSMNKDRKPSNTLDRIYQDVKIKEGQFVGPQTRKIMKDPTFDQILEGKEREAWEPLKVWMHFLNSHLDAFLKNRGAVSDRHGEKFLRDIATKESRYQVCWVESILIAYCWTVIRDTQDSRHTRGKPKGNVDRRYTKKHY